MDDETGMTGIAAKTAETGTTGGIAMIEEITMIDATATTGGSPVNADRPGISDDGYAWPVSVYRDSTVGNPAHADLKIQ